MHATVHFLVVNNKLTSRQHGKEIFQMVALCPAKNLLNWRKNEVEGYNGVYESHFFLRDSSRCWLQLKLDFAQQERGRQRDKGERVVKAEGGGEEQIRDRDDDDFPDGDFVVLMLPDSVMRCLVRRILHLTNGTTPDP
ncbi:hypothetical protein C4D60_Mb01t06500 [Musa balbisiana]|uniref:Uncharacterized protein n=1 Tax=Musa balbisiana TaxID=52838 RepID=A0A4S8JLM5_MUSBA|nr:hypothetical protein C4D60_Mb01t06500 [Musa balbisiana]